jgi:hypothetical protein
MVGRLLAEPEHAVRITIDTAAAPRSMPGAVLGAGEETIADTDPPIRLHGVAPSGLTAA